MIVGVEPATRTLEQEAEAGWSFWVRVLVVTARDWGDSGRNAPFVLPMAGGGQTMEAVKVSGSIPDMAMTVLEQ
jgi:hypothetical protein